MPGRILVVDDEPLKRITLQIELTEHGYEVFEAADAAAARRILDARPIDVVVTDVRMPGLSGLDLLTYVKSAYPTVEVILMTAYATIDTAVLAIKRGAHDYITKPFTTPELIVKLDALFAGRQVGQPERSVETFGRLVAASQSMRRLFEQLRGVAPTGRTVLLVGESGTGKELLAEAIHQLSPRAQMPLVRLSCAGLPADVLEGELFGHERGTVAGATRQKAGRFELASGGTLVLDEVDEIPPELQVRLLRVIEGQEVERAGGEHGVKVDVRLICTTRADLLKCVQAGRFREDLYYRLNVMQFVVPPLRERPDDIPLLAQHFVKKHGGLVANRPVRIAQHALDELLRRRWPGNVRELEHVIERALVFCGGDEIRFEHVVPVGDGATTESGNGSAVTATGSTLAMSEEPRLGLNETVADIERRMILMALRQCNNNQARAANRLGIPRTTLRDKMARYSIASTEADSRAETPA